MSRPPFVIGRALTARRPRARYAVGRDVRFVLPVLGRLPVRLRDRLILASLGLTRGAFSAIDVPAPAER